jgi:hypothetical protein
MKLILPTRWAPNRPIQIGDFTIRSNGRVKVSNEFGYVCQDSVAVETSKENWPLMNEWAAFHAFIFDDSNFLDWYESADRSPDTLLPEVNPPQTVDYEDISGQVYFPSQYPDPLQYKELHKEFAKANGDRHLVLNYFNSFQTRKSFWAERRITDNTFWRIVTLFSVVETIAGDVPKHSDTLSCSKTKKEIPWQHNDMSPKEWFKQSLSNAISDEPTLNEYLDLIVEVRGEIRHGLVHASSTPDASHVSQLGGSTIVYDWRKTKAEWGSDATALLSLELGIRKIARYLLLNRIFDLSLFPLIQPLQSTRIMTPSG